MGCPKNKSPAAQNTTEMGLEMHGVRSKLQKMGSNETVQTQVLPTWPVLRHCLLVPYVLLPMLGNASVPVLNCSFEPI